MPPKNEKKSAPENLALFQKLVATIPGVELKGDTNPYTSCNGNMFTHLTPEGELSMRLPEKEREVFLKKYKTTLQVSYGVVRKEYVVVPESLQRKTAELKTYFEISFKYAKTLKAKPTTRRKTG